MNAYTTGREMNRANNISLCALIILLFSFVFSCPVSADEGSDIVEKNLFSPEREKWTMESPDKTKKALKGKKDKVDDIILSGTIVSDRIKSAVLAVSTKRKPGKSSIYMEGDYMSGYLLKEISERNVVLQDVQSGEDYVIFLNDEKKNRTAVKTEIKERPKSVRADDNIGRKKEGRKKKKKKTRIVTTHAESGAVMKKRLQKSLDILERKNSSLVLKQAENDYRKLKKLSPGMSASEKKEIRAMRKQLDEIKKKDKQKEPKK